MSVSCDFKVRREGTLFLVSTYTVAGQQWIEQHVDTDNATRWCDELVVEHRFIDALVEGMKIDGMRVELLPSAWGVQ